MELLINELIKRGANAHDAGGQGVRRRRGHQRHEQPQRGRAQHQVRAGLPASTERIPVVSKDVLDIYPRKVCFLPAAARPWSSAWHRPIPTPLLAQERAAPRKTPVAAPISSGGGSVDLF
jgi:chemotaxis protein CheD